jgi:hypothetical protein
MRRSTARALALACASFLGGCTSRTTRENLLPWLRVTRTYRAFGSFPGSTEVTYSTRLFGVWWHDLDAWQASVLDGEAVVVTGTKGTGILLRGDAEPRPACPPAGFVSIPPGVAAVDCSEAVEHRDGFASAVRVRRVYAFGKPAEERRAAAPNDGRLIPTPASVLLYDGRGAPFVLVMDAEALKDYRRPPTRCALLEAGDGRAPSVEGPAGMTWDECRKAGSWAAVLGREVSQAESSRRP